MNICLPALCLRSCCYTLNLYFMDFLHSVYWNVWTVGSVSIFRLPFSKLEFYYMMSVCFQMKQELDSN